MQNRIIYPAIALCSILFFIYSIDVFFFNQFITPLTIIGTACSTAFLVMALNAWLIKDRELTLPEERKRQLAIGGIAIVFACLYGYFIASHAKDGVAAELDKYGIFTVGTIVDGKSEFIGGSQARIFVKYTDENGKDYEAVAFIPKYTFDDFSKEQLLGLRFMPKHPEIIRLLLTDEEMNKYSGFKNRPMELHDLITLINLTPGKKMQDYLNGVNLRWEMKTDPYRITYNFINRMKLQVVKASNRYLQFIYAYPDITIFNGELEKYHFKKQHNILGDLEYENGTYNLKINQMDIPVERETTNSPYRYRALQEYKKVAVFTLTRIAENDSISN